MAGYMGYVHCNVLYPCMNILVYARLQHKTVICQLILFNGESCMLNVFKTANSFHGETRSVAYANTARSPLPLFLSNGPTGHVHAQRLR